MKYWIIIKDGATISAKIYDESVAWETYTTLKKQHKDLELVEAETLEKQAGENKTYIF